MANPSRIQCRNIVLFGPPGVGKGAQAQMLGEQFQFAHVSTGEVLRDEIKRETELGLRVKEAVEHGHFADDETVLGIILGRIDLPEFGNGFIMDGFPRTLHQAAMLDRMLADRGRRIDCAIFIDAPRDVILERLAGRRICTQCGATYHAVFKRPEVEGKCDHCGGEVVKRHDDNPETHRDRLEEYATKTKPLVDYYKRSGVFVEINGEQSIDEVSKEIVSKITRSD